MIEDLFGSLDYCECEHCRSVLSQSAYYVDLLRSLDKNEQDWADFVTDWQQKRPAPYPFQNEAAWIAAGKPATNPKTPYRVLTDRRPDLPHIELSCENTHTAMPYIDIVNEILEWWVAYGSLGAGAAHNTGEATTAELLAEPQNIQADAYNKLIESRYPLSLPFDFWLETVRKFFDYFDVPLWKAMEAFRRSDALFGMITSDIPYYRSDIFAEYLGMSAEEYHILANSSADNWFELYGYQNEQSARDGLAPDDHGSKQVSAKKLARRLGVTYTELTEIVQSEFVNPALQKISIIWRLRLSVSDVIRYIKYKDNVAYADEKVAFEKRVEDFLNGVYGNDSKKPSLGEILNQLISLYEYFGNALVLRDVAPPSTGGDKYTACDFDRTTLEYAEPARPPSAMDLLRINLFVRLWKKLGWSIEETDRALAVFHSPPQAVLASALVYLAHLKALDERVEAGSDSKIKLLTLWADLPTTGKNSLYAQLFLKPSVLKNDPIFDDPLGNYLPPSSVPDRTHRLQSHMQAVQGAVGLTTTEITSIFGSLGEQELERLFPDISGHGITSLLGKGEVILAQVVLSLPAVSLLYRYSLFAKALDLSVTDLLALKRLSGLDPFRSLSPEPLASINDDHPFSDTLRFVDVATKIQNSGFTLEDVDYLLAHHFDPVGKYRPDMTPVIGLFRSLGADVLRIRGEHAVPRNPLSFTDEVLRQKLALLCPPDAVQTFLAWWTGTIRVEPIQAQAKSFFETNFPFLDAGKFELFFNTRKEADVERRAAIANGLLPEIQSRLIQELIIQTLANNLQADPVLARTLLTETEILTAPGLPEPTPLFGAFASAVERGVSASFFASADLSGSPLAVDGLTVVTADSVASDANGAGTQTPIKPIGTNSVKFEGYFEVPASDAYTFSVEFSKQDARVEFWIEPFPDPLLRTAAVKDSDTAVLDQPIELKHGVPYRFRLDGHKLSGSNIRLLVQSKTLPKGPMSRLILYPLAAIERFTRAFTLLSKALQLIQGFKLSEREVRFLFVESKEYEELDLTKLPIAPGVRASEVAANLSAQFLRLADYASLKNTLAAGGDELVDLFLRARRSFPITRDEDKLKNEVFTDVCKRVADLTRRELEVVKNTAKELGFSVQAYIEKNLWHVEATDFTQEKGLARLWEALQIVERLRIAPPSIGRWLSIRSSAPTQNGVVTERPAIARDLKNTVKALYDPETWQAVAQPIFDHLRRRQRDALVAFIMHQKNYDQIEELFSDLLIDPGMEPMVQTSRLQLAISSVQTFIQRCLLNLEPEVASDPFIINANHWEWRKRYRVWEANRKIFLYPENWLEPEFRDGKTHLFRELEGALLQSDLSTDATEAAFYTYLQKLEKLARLDIVTMYHEELPGGSDDYKLHVIGRTYGDPREYFYRTYSQGEWTPWEPVNVPIEGDHVSVVVWRKRPFLFWLTLIQKAEAQDPTALDTSDASLECTPANSSYKTGYQAITKALPHKKLQLTLKYSYYMNGSWVAPEGSGIQNTIESMVDDNFDINNAYNLFMYLDKVQGTDDRMPISALTYGASDPPYMGITLRSILDSAAGSSFPFPHVVALYNIDITPELLPYANALNVFLGISYPFMLKSDKMYFTKWQLSGPLTLVFHPDTVVLVAGTRLSKADILQADGSAYLTRISTPFQMFLNDSVYTQPFFYNDSVYTQPFFYADRNADYTFFAVPTLRAVSFSDQEDPPSKEGWQPPPDPGPVAEPPFLPIPPEDPLGKYSKYSFKVQGEVLSYAFVRFDGEVIAEDGQTGLSQAGALGGQQSIILEGLPSQGLLDLRRTTSRRAIGPSLVISRLIDRRQ